MEALPGKFTPIKLEFGKIHVILHEIAPVKTASGTQYMVAFHITDYETGKVIKTPTAHIFIQPPVLASEETRGLSDDEKAKLWREKFINELKEKLMAEVEEYKRNRHIFTL